MTSYGLNACPPLLVGVGVATSVETAALLSKKALMRPIGSHNENERAAKMEKLLEDGINAIGFSLDSYDLDADFDHLDGYITAITRKVLCEGLPDGVCLNVNFPIRSEEPIRGLKICRQAKAKWIEAYSECQDETGGTCLKLGGQFICDDLDEDTDHYALKHNYVSLVPTHFDLTAKQYLETMRRFEHVLE